MRTRTIPILSIKYWLPQ